MRPSKFLLFTLIAVALAACTEKPKGAKDGGGSSGTFGVKSPVKAEISKTTLHPKTQLPRSVSYEFEICFNDLIANSPLVDQPMVVKSEIDGKVLVRQGTDLGGCIKVPTEIEFQFLGQNRYVEYPILVTSSGRHRGEIRYRLALNPWAALLKDSKYRPLVDLEKSQLPTTKYPLVKAGESLKALHQLDRGPKGPKLFLKDVRTTITEAKYSLKGTYIDVSVSAGAAAIRFEDAGGDDANYEINRGELRIQPQLYHYGPTAVPLYGEQTAAKSQGREIQMVALHDPVPAKSVQLSQLKTILVSYTALIPNYNKVGKVLVALDTFYANFDPETAAERESLQIERHLPSRFKFQDVCAQRSWSKIMPFQYSSLYDLGSAQDPIKATIALPIADTVHGFYSAASSGDENQNKHTFEEIATLACQPQFDFQALKAAAITTTEINALVDDNRLSNPYNPSVNGWQPTIFTVLKMLRPGNEGVTRGLESVEALEMSETVLERTNNIQFSLCIENFFTLKPLAGYKIDVSVDGRPVEGKDQVTDTRGCFSWPYAHTFNRFDIQWFALKFVHVENAQLGIDQEIPLAINPWDAGWSLGRDMRVVSSCLKDAQLVKGRVANTSSQVLECVKRKDFPEACKDKNGKVLADQEVVFNQNPSGEITARCVPKTLMARSKNLSPRQINEALLKEFRPAVDIKKIDFMFQRAGYTIGEHNSEREELLGLKHYREYLIELNVDLARQDDVILGKEDKPEKIDGIYYARIVFQRNPDEDRPNTADKFIASEIKYPKDNCRTSEVGSFKDPRPDKGYITHFEGLVEVRHHQAKFPITINFQQMYLLGSRNRVIVQLLPLDPKFERKMRSERVYSELNGGLQMMNPRVAIPPEAFPARETLGSPVYQGTWTIFSGSGERDSAELAVTCQSAQDVIAASKSFPNDWRERNKKQYGVEQPNDMTIADTTFEKFKSNFNLKEIKLSTEEGEATMRTINSSINNMVSRPLISSSSKDPINRLIDFRLKSVDPKELENDYWDLNELKANYPVDLKRLVIDGVDDWKQLISFYENMGRSSIHGAVEDYLLKRHIMMRKLCMYWASGQIYKDVYNMPVPFETNQAPPLRGWSFDNPRTYQWDISRNLYPPSIEEADICKNPDKVLQIDKRIRILEIEPNSVEYLGGNNENYQVNTNRNMQYRIGADTSQSQADQNTLRYFTLGVANGIATNLGDIALQLMPLPLRVAYAGLPDYNRTHSWTSSRSVNIGVSNDRANTFSKGTYLVVQKMDFSINILAYDKCLVVRPNFDFFKYKNWRKNGNGSEMALAEKRRYINQGIILCLGRESFNKDLQPPSAGGLELMGLKIIESYYYIAQHFTPSAGGGDATQHQNRPWLMLIRGTRDYIQWISQIESLVNRKQLLGDSAKRSTISLLRSPYISPDEIQRGDNRHSFYQRADNRFPSYDGMYAVFEDPYYHLDETTFTYDKSWDILRAVSAKETNARNDCDKGILQMMSFDFIKNGAEEPKNLPCTIEAADRLAR